MKRNFDFLIDKDEGFSKKVLRFYPKQSRVHGFGDEPPKEWEGVYKTYMSFSVLMYEECWDNEGFYESPRELFSYYRDEGEGLRELREVLSKILAGEGKSEYSLVPFGDGIDWDVVKHKKKDDVYIFTMINSYTGLCYKFSLTLNRIEDFYNVLDDFLEYMLKHSVGI